MDHPVGAFISGLRPGTIYFYRVVAGNAAGLAFGQARTFTTQGMPTGLMVPRLTLSVRTKRDKKEPYTYRARCRLVRPSGVTAAEGCNGTITVRVRRGNRLVGRATTPLRANCRYSKRVTVTKKPQRINGRGRRQGKLTIRSYFGGNDALAKARSPKRWVAYGSGRLKSSEFG